jgi:hypothetical protein
MVMESCCLELGQTMKAANERPLDDAGAGAPDQGSGKYRLSGDQAGRMILFLAIANTTLLGLMLPSPAYRGRLSEFCFDLAFMNALLMLAILARFWIWRRTLLRQSSVHGVAGTTHFWMTFFWRIGISLLLAGPVWVLLRVAGVKVWLALAVALLISLVVVDIVATKKRVR